MRKLFLAVIALSFILPVCHPETITLKNGKTIEGKITEKTGEYIKVDFYGVPLKYYTEDIETIGALSKGAAKGSIRELLEDAG